MHNSTEEKDAFKVHDLNCFTVWCMHDSVLEWFIPFALTLFIYLFYSLFVYNSFKHIIDFEQII